METNANSPLTAAVLAKAHVGRFTSILIQKRGEERGKGPDRKVYGDDTVYVVVITGFNYPRLVQRSLTALDGVLDSEIVEGAAATGITLTEKDVADARAEMKASFESTLAGTNESTTEDVFEPLVADGETVQGCKVYRCKRKSGAEGDCHCRECTGWTPDMKGRKPPLDGTIHVTGLQVWKKVLVPAANGPVPEPKSSAKTIAKNLLREHCPIRRFVQYALEPGANWSLHAGGSAALEATEKGFIVSDDILSVASSD